MEAGQGAESVAQGGSQRATHGTQADRLSEELEQNIAPPGAHGLAEPDLAGSLGAAEAG